MSTRRHTAAAAGALVVLLVVSASAAAQQAATKIAPRDQLAVSVWNGGVNESSYSGKFPVDIDGTFEYPTIGRVKAAGLTAREVEADLATRLGKYLVSPQVTVEIEQSTTRKVIMAGEVKMPASYAFAGELTLFEALTRAGALTEEAGEEAVIHRRSTADSPEETIRVDLYDMLSGQSMKNNLVLRDGDTVVVPKSDPVYIVGFVQSPGPLRVKRGTTVQQALSMAGGVTDRGSTRSIKIQRMVDGKKKDVPVKNINTDTVKPGDTIVVSARIF
jgi:polysaccharide export outer membrane protein